MIKPGDVVFFRKFKRTSDRKGAEGMFKGHGFGIFLGHVQPFEPDPPPVAFRVMLGGIGFVAFDDIGEFLGKEVMQEVVQKFEAKYYNLANEAKKNHEVAKSKIKKPLGLVDASGKPMENQ